MDLMIVSGILIYIRFMISGCMFIVSKVLLISSVTVIVRAGGVIWLNPFAMMLFNVCSAVTIECCTRVVCVCLLLSKEEDSSLVSAITGRRDMGLYEVPLSMSWLGFGMGIMLANFHMCGIMLVLRAVFNILVRNASPNGPMCFRCLTFSLSGPCELLFLLCFIASWT